MTSKLEHGITDLEWRLHQTLHYKTTDDRDKLYALLGLDKQQSIQVLPNYERSTRHLYADFICGASRIDKLLLCGTNGVGYKRKRTPGMPSWVPDLRTKQDATDNDLGEFGECESMERVETLGYTQQEAIHNDLIEFGGCESIGRLRRTGRCQVHAAGVSKSSATICDVKLNLTAKGAAIDHIEAFEPPGYSFDPTAIAIASQIRWHKVSS